MTGPRSWLPRPLRVEDVPPELKAVYLRGTDDRIEARTRLFRAQSKALRRRGEKR